MSVLNKQPFVKKVLATLSDEQKASLAQLINGASTTIFRSFINNSYPLTDSDEGVSHCVLEAKDKVFTGYLVYTDDYCVLFAYEEKSQKMHEVAIDYANDKYEIKDEELSVLEFRELVEGVGGDVDYKEIVSGDANEGTVLTADGDGGTEWRSVFADDILKQVAGYDPQKIQTLKQGGGSFMFVDDEE